MELNKLELLHTQELVNGLTAVYLNAAKDGDPRLTAIRVDARSFIACDRYTVGHYQHTDVTPTDDYMLVDRTAAEWLCKQKPLYYGHHTAIFEPHQVSLVNEFGALIGVSAFTEREENPAYPPIEKLLNTSPAKDVLPLRLSAQHLTKFTTAATRASRDKNNQVLVLTPTGSANPTKPGPVEIEIPAIPGFKGLLQPNIVLR
jgi:hypothetical protein